MIKVVQISFQKGDRKGGCDVDMWCCTWTVIM